MKYLKVMLKDAPLPGGKAILLCDADGEPLPHQMSCTLTSDIDENGPATLTVEFLIDGDVIRLASDGDTQ